MHMKRVLFLFAVLLSSCVGRGADAGVVYSVSIDTSAIDGSPGSLLFQLNTAGAINDAQGLTAKISQFVMDGGGSLGSVGSVTGAVAGDLSSELVLDNGPTAINLVFQGIKYGSNLHFQLALSGAAVDAATPGTLDGTTFAVGVLDVGGLPALASGTDPAIQIDVFGGDSEPSITTIAPEVSIVAAVPEPSTLVGASLTTIAIWMFACRRVAAKLE